MLVSEKLNSISIEKKIPLSLTWELTYKCPLNCAHCYITKTQKRQNKDKELSLEEIKTALKQFRRAKVFSIVFTGGEPLLRNDLEKIIAFSKMLKFETVLYSSLYEVSFDRLEKLKKSGLNRIEVSLYGKPGTHNLITKRSDSFAKTFVNIKYAVKLGFAVKIKMPFLQANAKDVKWLRNLAKKNKMLFSVDPLPTPLNDGKDLPENLKPKKKDLKNLFSAKWFEIEKNDSSQNPYSSLPCGAGFNTFSVTPSGDIYPCVQFPYLLGNIKKEKFKDIWFSLKAEKFRKNILKWPKKCLLCSLKDFCFRCPGIAYLKRDINFVDETNCFCAETIKKIYN